jgi:hypothetical protein
MQPAPAACIVPVFMFAANLCRKTAKAEIFSLNNACEDLGPHGGSGRQLKMAPLNLLVSHFIQGPGHSAAHKLSESSSLRSSRDNDKSVNG